MEAVINSWRSLAGSTSANIDNHVFRAYYIFTSSLLLAAAGVLLTGQFFGEPIDCISDNGPSQRPEHLKKSVDNFCWTSATYTINELYGRHRVLDVKLDEGIGGFNATFQTKRFQLYYRWITLFLLVHAVTMYLPHYFWKSWESNKMQGLSKMLNVPVEPTQDQDRRTARIELLLNYLQEVELNSHGYYTYRFYICEVANLVLMLVNVWLTQWITDGMFLSIGIDFLQFGIHSSVLQKLFPTRAKCDWSIIGPSGNVQPMDALCLLPLNSFNKVLFTFLWFWYLLLGVTTVIWLTFRALTAFKFVRSNLLRWKACPVNDLRHRHSGETDCIDAICQELPHADWFVVLQLVDNTDSVVIKYVLSGLCERLSHMNRKRNSSCPEIIYSDEKPLLNMNSKGKPGD